MIRGCLVVLLWLTVLCSGCVRGDAIRIGAKSFAEQSLLAVLVRETVRSAGLGPATVIDCGDTFGCHQALRAGRIDLMVEYTGTGALYTGAGTDASMDLTQLRAAYHRLGLAWLDPIGFGNEYQLVMLSHRAALLGVRSIADLERDGDGFRITCPSEYLQRPRDGLASLVKRHGLRLRDAALVEDDPADRIQALLEHRADVAVVYATDGVLRGLDVTVLEDTLGFFPAYDAAILVREDTLERVPRLGEILGGIRISTETMRDLNYAVAIEGWGPRSVARRYLSERTPQGPVEPGAPKLLISVDRDEPLEAFSARAIRAVRKVFPDRPVELQPSRDPTALVARGTARLALVGAERFFDRDRTGRVRREPRLIALAVVGSRMLHLVRRSDDSGEQLSGAVGVPAKGSGGARVAEGSIDAALILAEPGDARLAQALAANVLSLRSVPQPPIEGAPYLAAARIPAGTYSGQTRAIDTLASQLVLAAAAPHVGRGASVGGPAGALSSPGLGSALTAEQVQTLAQSTGIAETPDPVLPSLWTVRRGIVDSGEQASRIADGLLNALTLLFLAWLVVTVVRQN